jgi:hypothetical protein
MAVYSETDSGSLPTAEDLAGWAGTYGIDFPVMEDPGSEVYWRFGTGSLPSMTLLGPGLEVLETGWVDPDAVEKYIYE